MLQSLIQFELKISKSHRTISNSSNSGFECHVDSIFAVHFRKIIPVFISPLLKIFGSLLENLGPRPQLSSFQQP
jgi:hypothetical protein